MHDSSEGGKAFSGAGDPVRFSTPWCQHRLHGEIAYRPYPDYVVYSLCGQHPHSGRIGVSTYQEFWDEFKLPVPTHKATMPEALAESHGLHVGAPLIVELMPDKWKGKFVVSNLYDAITWERHGGCMDLDDLNDVEELGTGQWKFGCLITSDGRG